MILSKKRIGMYSCHLRRTGSIFLSCEELVLNFHKCEESVPVPQTCEELVLDFRKSEESVPNLRRLIWFCKKNFPISIGRTSLFQILGVFFFFMKIHIEYSVSKQWRPSPDVAFCGVRTRRLIWVCAVCLWPKKRTLGSYGLMLLIIHVIYNEPG